MTPQDLIDSRRAEAQVVEDLVAALARAVVENGDLHADLGNCISALATANATIADLREQLADQPPPVVVPPVSPLAAILTPPAGKLFIGATNTSGVTQHATIVGRKAHFHHAYSKSSSEFLLRLGSVPAGMVPFINCKPLGAMGAKAYQAIIDGDADLALTAISSHCRTYGKPMVVAWLHEPEDDDKTGDSDPLYAMAFRYIVEFVRRQGVTNVTHGWNMMAFAQWQTRLDSLYPGNDVVDIIMGDPYCHDATETLSTIGVPKGAGKRFYDWAAPKGKPIWWAEWGIDKPTAAIIAPKILTPAGLAQMQKDMPLLACLCYWNEALPDQSKPGDADYRLSNFAPTWKAFALLSTFDVDLSAVAKT